MRDRQLGSATRPITFLMVSSVDHITGMTGLSPVVTVSKDGGSFAAPVGAVSEIGNGWYALAGDATDRNTLGAFLLHATGTGADVLDVQYDIVAYDPYDAQRLGLTALPSTGTLAVPLDAAGTRSALGLAAANLDTQLAGIDADVLSRLATASYTAPNNAGIASIVAKLPANNIADETLLLAAIGTPMQAGNVTLAASQPNYAPAKAGDAMTLTSAYDAAKTAAQAGDEMDLVNAPNATAVTAIQNGLSKPGTAQTVDGTSPLTESYNAGPMTLAQALYEIAQVVGQNSVAGTTITVQKRDKTTTAATFTTDDADNPTSRTRTT